MCTVVSHTLTFDWNVANDAEEGVLSAGTVKTADSPSVLAAVVALCLKLCVESCQCCTVCRAQYFHVVISKFSPTPL